MSRDGLPLPAQLQPRLALYPRGERVGVRGSKRLEPLRDRVGTRDASLRGHRLLLPLTLVLSPQERGEGILPVP